MTAALLFRDLGHAYRRGCWVFRNCSATIQRGSVFAVLGPNGRGKTTLLKILLGALAPTEGCVERSGRVAFVPQLFHLNFDLTVLDVVLMGRARRVGVFAQPSARDEAAVLSVLHRFGLHDLASRPFSELSSGQRQLVIFARALVAEADILVLDEPASALDLRHQQVILEWIDRLAREDGLTVLLTTHHPNHALAVADEALLMLAESSFLCGPVNRVLTEEHLENLYGVPLKRVAFEHNGAVGETLTPIYTARGRSEADRTLIAAGTPPGTGRFDRRML